MSTSSIIDSMKNNDDAVGVDISSVVQEQPSKLILDKNSSLSKSNIMKSASVPEASIQRKNNVLVSAEKEEENFASRFKNLVLWKKPAISATFLSLHLVVCFLCHTQGHMAHRLFLSFLLSSLVLSFLYVGSLRLIQTLTNSSSSKNNNNDSNDNNNNHHPTKELANKIVPLTISDENILKYGKNILNIINIHATPIIYAFLVINPIDSFILAGISFFFWIVSAYVPFFPLMGLIGCFSFSVPLLLKHNGDKINIILTDIQKVAIDKAGFALKLIKTKYNEFSESKKAK